MKKPQRSAISLSERLQNQNGEAQVNELSIDQKLRLCEHYRTSKSTRLTGQLFGVTRKFDKFRRKEV